MNNDLPRFCSKKQYVYYGTKLRSIIFEFECPSCENHLEKTYHLSDSPAFNGFCIEATYCEKCGKRLEWRALENKIKTSIEEALNLNKLQNLIINVIERNIRRREKNESIT